MQTINSYINIQDCIASPYNTFFASNSVDAGNNTNYSIVTGTAVFCNHVNVQDCNASPASTFYGINSINAGNNTGFTFLNTTGVYSRIKNTGDLLIDAGRAMVFDEVLINTIRLGRDSFYANEFDEVTKPGNAMRHLNTGTVQIDGQFDETTLLN